MPDPSESQATQTQQPKEVPDAVQGTAVEVPIPPYKPPLPERLGIAPRPKPTKAKPVRHGYTGVVLAKKGDAEVYAIPDGPAIKRPAHKGGGIYVKETTARFWLPEPIPPGWLTIWCEDDPEPFSGRDPVGYGSRTLDLLTGSHVAHVIGLGMKEGIKPLPDWAKRAAIAIVGILVIAFTVWWFVQKFGGAA